MSNYSGEYKPSSQNNNWNMAFDLVKDNSQVLDIGCSKGSFGEALIALKGCIVDGVEPDAGDAKTAKDKLSSVFNKNISDAIKYDIRDKKYDHIVMLDVIEHLYNPVDILTLLKNNLKPGGSVIFSIPNMAHISSRIMLLGGNFTYGKTGILDNTHLHFYTKSEILRIFNESGYGVKDIKGVVVDYDRNVLIQELSKLGIKTPQTELIDVLKGNNGDIYQFVGMAKTSLKGINVKDRDFSSPNAKGNISYYYQSMTNDIQERCKKELDKKEVIITEIRHELGLLNNRLDSIVNSKSWRFISKIKKIIRR